MTRENKTQLRMALNENYQEDYEEIHDLISEVAWMLFDDGLLEEEVTKICEKDSILCVNRLNQFHTYNLN
jgi:hypothetical protein